MYELKKKIGKLLTSKSVVTGPSSYEIKKKLLGRGLTEVEKHWYTPSRCKGLCQRASSYVGELRYVTRKNTVADALCAVKNYYISCVLSL